MIGIQRYPTVTLLVFALTVSASVDAMSPPAASPAGTEDNCSSLIPAGGPYDVFRSYRASDFQLSIDEFVSDKQWTTHQEALNAGLSVGTIVYGVPLQVGGTFDQAKVDQWKRDYQSRTKLDYIEHNRTAFEQLMVNVPLVKAVTDCIVRTKRVFGLSTRHVMSGDCEFTFVASYISDRPNAKQPKLQGALAFTGAGACTAWPQGVPVPPNGYGVNCRRYGRNGVIVTINTDTAGTSQEVVEPLPTLGPEPPAPICSIQQTKPDVRSATVYRTDWKDGGSDGRGGNMVYFDLSAPGKITSIDVTGCSGCGGHLWLCPDGGVCGRDLFQPQNDTTWRAWAHLNASDATWTSFRINFLGPQEVCVPDRETYEHQHAAWDAENARTCPLKHGEPSWKALSAQ